MIFDNDGLRLDAAPADDKLSDKSISTFICGIFEIASSVLFWAEMFLRWMVVIIRYGGGLFANFLFRKLMQMLVVDAVGCPPSAYNERCIAPVHS